MTRFIIILGLLIFSQKSLNAQVNLHLETIELEDTSDSNIYIYGSFNNWIPGDSLYLLTEDELNPGKYNIRLPESIILPIEFKFNRGSAYKVEANAAGAMIPNRSIETTGDYTFFISNWEDKPSIKKKYLAKIRVRDIPDNPGKNESIYVIGNFNNWDIGDKTFELNRSRTDLWEIDIPFGRDTFLYKFHRGNWESMEGKINGRARGNRAILTNEWINDYLSLDKIESWEDVHGSILNPYSIILGIAGLFCLFVSLILILKISQLKKMGSILLIWLFILGIGLICRAIMFNRLAFHNYPKLFVIPGLLAFYGFPLYVLFTKDFLKLKVSWKKSWSIYMFIPAIIWTIYLMRFIFMANQELINFIVEDKFAPIHYMMGVTAFIFNLPILIILKQLSKKKSSLKDKELLRKKRLIINTLSWFLTVSVTLLGTVVLLGAYFFSISEVNTELRMILDFLTDLIWVLIGFSAIALGVFTIFLPKVFSGSVMTQVIKKFDIPKIEPVPTNDKKETELQEQILCYMEAEKPYLDAKLSLGSLAEKLDVSSHQLSKIINDDFQKNFNDFINTYRIEEFKRIIISGEHPNLTLISYGYMVGFNSKSSFNRSFKRITGKTPGDFFSSVQKH